MSKKPVVYVFLIFVVTSIAWGLLREAAGKYCPGDYRIGIWVSKTRRVSGLVKTRLYVCHIRVTSYGPSEGYVFKSFRNNYHQIGDAQKCSCKGKVA